MQLYNLLKNNNLLHDVQMQEVFPDGKTFVDCEPKIPETGIIEQYSKLKNEPGLSGF